MAPMLSPPPAISSFQEPEPSSDEDLVPNDPAAFLSSARRKRKRSKQETSQPKSKRPNFGPVATQNSFPSSSRQLNAVAGPSKPSYRPKSPTRSNGVVRQASSSNPATKSSAYHQPVSKVTTENTSAASTKRVRRTRKEKGRQRDSDSDSDPATFTPKPNTIASASAPVPKRRPENKAFGRDALGARFTNQFESAPTKRKTVKAPVVIEIEDTSEEERPVKIVSTEIIHLDSDSESAIIQRSAARKQNGIKTAPPTNQEPIELITSSDDEPAPPKVKPGKAEDAGSTNKIEEAGARQMPDGFDKHPSPDPMNLDLDEGMDFSGEDLFLQDGLMNPRSKTPPRNAPAGPPAHDTQHDTQHPPMQTVEVPGDGASEYLSSLQRGPPEETPATPLQEHEQDNTPDLGEGPQDADVPVDNRSPPVSPQPTEKRTSPNVPPPSPALLLQGGIPDASSAAQSNLPSPTLANKSSLLPVPILPPALPDLKEMPRLEARMTDAPSPISAPPTNSLATRTTPAPRSPSPPPLRPNGHLPSQPEAIELPLVLNSSSLHPSKPPSLRKSARPSLPTPNAASHSLSSPYKGLRDRALGTPADTLKQNLGLPVKDTASVPRLDLSTLQIRRPPLPLSRTKTPPSTSMDLPDSPHPEQIAGPAENFRSSASPSPKKPPIPQRILVEDLIASGLHNARSTITPPLPRRRRPPPRVPSPRRVPSSRAPSVPSPPRPPSPRRVQPPSVLSIDERTALTPPVKLEETPSGSSASLIKTIIDLTLSSDDEANAPPPPPRAPENAHRKPVDRETFLKNAERISKLMAKHRRGAAASRTPSMDAASPSPPPNITITPKARSLPCLVAMDVDGSAEDSGMDRPTTSDRPPPPLWSFGGGDPMMVDGDGIWRQSESREDASPPQLKQPSVPEALDPVPLTVAEAEAADLPRAIDGDAPPTPHPWPNEAPMKSPVPVDSAPSLERRSYDDTEVYHLEYIGPPTTYVTELDEVEDLLAPRSATEGPFTPETLDPEPEQVLENVSRDMDVDSEHASDDESASSASGFVRSQNPGLEASEDDVGSASPKPPVRRSSRRSSQSYSTDPLDLFTDDFDEDLDTPMSPLSATDVAMRVVSPPARSSAERTDENPYPIMTWDSYRQDLSNFQIPVYYAKDLVSLLHDYINASDEYSRAAPNMRHVFECAIRENTAEDEPDAPWISVVNEVDDEGPTPPWEFYYTNKLWLGEGISPPDIADLKGCDCKGKCEANSTTCACLKRQTEYLTNYNYAAGFQYDSKGRLNVPGMPIFECNALCACDDDECKNRVVQHGRKVGVSIKKTLDKGWGVFATKKIHKGTFIGIYAGEFLREEISEGRGLVYDKSGRTYLLDIDFWYLDTEEYVVDAYHVGNFTRFLNNSCDPNCIVTPCYINEPDIRRPLITLFAKRDIAPNEELCFSYQGYDPDNPDEDEGKGKGKGANSITNVCHCGAARCTGVMFG